MKPTAEQLAVIGLDSGRHLVLAPPGSGKTEMLSQRIVRALRAGVAPERMLCATFTNRAAFEMRDRVASVAEDLTLPDVGNLHHFCHRFLISAGRLPAGKNVLDEVQQRDFIREVADVLREELKTGRPADVKKTHGVTVMGGVRGMCEPMRQRLHGLLEATFSDYARLEKDVYADILSAVLVSHQRRIGIPPCYLRPLPPGMFALAGANAISAIERAYSGLKRKFRSVDFDDLVNETYLFVGAHPLPEERRFRWVQIDEVQDLNPLQWRIVREFTATGAVSVYFGDVEQSIFSFLGASAGNFGSEVADCDRHYFKTNFRATPLLLEVLMRYSLTALRSDWEFLPAPADAARANGALTMSAGKSDAEVVGRIRSLLESGTAESVALLVRTNAEADDCERLVRQLGHRTAKVSGLDLFAYAPMRDFMAFVSLFTERPPMTAWVALFRRFGGIPTRVSARYFVRGMFAAGWDPRRLFASRNPVPLLPSGASRRRNWAWGHRRALLALRRVLKPAFDTIAARSDSPLGFREVFGAFASVAFDGDGRYSLRELVPERKRKDGDRESMTFEEGRERAFERMETFLRYTDFTFRDGKRPFGQLLSEDWDRLSKLKEADLLVGDERIVISTIHKAKGRQFDAVILPDAEGVLKGPGGEDPEEAYRLLYVAMSRAKRHLSMFGCGKDVSPYRELACCFESGYAGYYLRKSRGEVLEGDWLCAWERLAESNLRRECPLGLVELALASSVEPLVRMALKVLRHATDAEAARQIYFASLGGGTADAAVACLADLGRFDAETAGKVRVAALGTRLERVRRAALAYCRKGLSVGASRELLLASVGDFLYARRGEIRLEAATLLFEHGVTWWEGLVTGAHSDLERLASVKDRDHEMSIRAILETKPSGKYEKALREILFKRAAAN